MPIFQANFPQNRASNKSPPVNIGKKICHALRRNISNLLLQQISSSPPPTNCSSKQGKSFLTLWKYQPSLASCEPCTVLCPGQCIFKVLLIPSAEITVYRVNSILPTDFATLAFQDGDPYR